MTADDIIRLLNLQPHPEEDGYFVETYRSNERLTWESLPARYDGTRCFATSIYFMLRAGGFSEMHRLRSDEVFHFYLGAPAELLLLDAKGGGEIVRLGPDLATGEKVQFVVPRGCWQGMRTTGDFTLLGTTVAPGFEYSDYESGNRENLIRNYPAFAHWITRLTHP